MISILFDFLRLKSTFRLQTLKTTLCNKEAGFINAISYKTADVKFLTTCFVLGRKISQDWFMLCIPGQ